jgi:hydroxymethylbilane synthase|uniref:Hydroxymethylbilane synthase n=1 Tax=uncultured marine bacterium EB80_02D08 TaxID=415441 RepID=A4GJT7_9BACT|nr:porphobilinogen deaminase [uncultured marine bacterium EB80_02D08]
MKIKIATRQSELAMYQANFVANEIKKSIKDVEVELIPMTSEGDQTNKPLHEIGGKGLFISTLESALESNKVDIAVHSLKDVPARLDPKFKIINVFKRESPSDLLLSKDGKSFSDFLENATIGTSGPRRKAQINYLRPDIKTIPVRGNIATRINKLNEGYFDGLVVAKAAINRLGLQQNSYEFSIDEMLPAASQGHIATECLSSNKEIIETLESIGDSKELILANAERSFVASMDGGCLSPIAILCQNFNDEIKVIGKVLSYKGDKLIYKKMNSSFKDIDKDIISFADEFILEGAKSLISE